MLRRIGIASITAGALTFAASTAAAAQEVPQIPSLPEIPTLTLIGTGEVRARPDLAVVRIGVVSQAATAREALDQNNRAMAAVLSALKEQGIAERDLQTSNFNVSPRYDYSRDRAPPRIDGYEVSNQVAVTIRDLDKLGSVLDQTVSVGSNQIIGIDFGLDDPEAVRDEARRLAVRDAMRKARLYAEEAGVELGPIHSMSERFEMRPPTPQFAQIRAAPEAAAVPIEAGEQSVEAEITMTWTIR